MFHKATKEKCKARVCLCGVSGSGKTYSALKIATAMGGRIAVIDSERGSASKYADEFEFDTCNDMPDFSPKCYIEAIKAAEKAGYDILVIDSLTHAWAGTGGALEMVDSAAARSRGNSYVAWREVTPWHNKLVEAMVNSTAHVIATLRTKADYILETVNGKQNPKKVGMAPIQREGMEYEFDVVGDMDLSHTLTITKTRCRPLDGKQFQLPGEDVAELLTKWLNSGEAPKARVAKPEPKPEAPPPQQQAIGSVPAEAQKVIAAFKEIGVSQDDCEAHVGKLAGGWRKNEYDALRKFYTKCKAQNEAVTNA